jgi:hypothetical protein
VPIWINIPGDTWKQATPHVSNGTVYKPATKAFRWSGSTWQEIWAKNTYPPNPPTVSATLKSGTKNVLNINVKTPSTQPGKIARAVVKVGVNRWPTGPETNDGCYYATSARTPNGSYEKWSEWWVGTRPDNPKALNGTKQFPATEMTEVKLPLGTPIRIAAYLQDEHGQWSSAGTGSITTAKADSTTTAPTQGYVPTLRDPIIRSASWFRSYTSNNAPYSYQNDQGNAVQGNTPYDSWGLLRSLIGFPSVNQLLSGADIVKIEVEVLMKHWHYPTGGMLSIGLHGHTGAPGSFSHLASAVVQQRYTARNQKLWTTIPSQYYAGFRNGTYRGISLFRQSDDPIYYGYADAMATKLKITFKS